MSAAQLVLHVVAPHAYVTHEVVPCLHAPAASHVPGFVCVVPVQLVLPQLVALPGYAHDVALVPSHFAPHVPLPLHAARLPTGAPTTLLQVPSALGTLHAWHCPAHALLQQ